MVYKKSLSTVNDKRKWATGLGSLLAAIWLLSCTGPVTATRSAGETVLPSATPTSLPMPGNERTPTTLVGSPTAEPTPTPTPTSTPLNCGGVGSLMFARGGSLYLACADGSAEQEIVSKESWLPASRFLRGLALSPSGENVAVLEKNKAGEDAVWRLLLIELANGSVTEIHRFTSYVPSPVSWSPDGEYVGYAASDSYQDWLEVLHVESQTISQVATAESVSGRADRVVDILSFDWSPEGTQVAYVALIDGVYSQRPTVNGYVANIDCASPSYTCTVSNQRVLPWVNSWRTLKWAPDGTSLSTGYVENHETSVIELRRPEGELLQRIDLSDLFPEMQIVDSGKPTISPGGSHIAFLMRGDNGIELFVLNLDTQDIVGIAQNVDPVDVQWVPSK
jgi:Tol biopolymer transport system component